MGVFRKILFFALSVYHMEVCAANVNSDAATACREFGATLAIKNVKVNFAEHVPAGTNVTFSQAYNLSSCGITSQIVSNDLCRVAMYVATSHRSGKWTARLPNNLRLKTKYYLGITLEAWLPTNWTGRFLSRCSD